MRQEKKQQHNLNTRIGKVGMFKGNDIAAAPLFQTNMHNFIMNNLIQIGFE